MSNNRKILSVSYSEEQLLIRTIAADLLLSGFNANNTIVVTVSTDYSSIIGQVLRHLLSKDGEVCDGFGVDVPYPDEHWNEDYIYNLEIVVAINQPNMSFKKVLLVEAGVIRGGNYTFIERFFKGRGITDIYTVAMFENIHSTYKSTYVGEYYDNDTQDLTF